MADRTGRVLPGPLLAGFAFSAIGGPLALTALLFPDAAGAQGISSIGLITVAGVALFAAPMLVWWRYSGEIASSGGLYTFVERAAGRRIALAHGAAWILSYFLYLPFTVTALVARQIPVVPGHQGAPGRHRDRRAVRRRRRRDPRRAGRHGPHARERRRPARSRARPRRDCASPLGGRRERVSVAPHSPGRWHAALPTRPLSFLCASLPLYLGGEGRRRWPRPAADRRRSPSPPSARSPSWGRSRTRR